MRAALLIFLVTITNLHAHGVRLFASFAGNRLEGRAYSGSNGIADATITLTTLDGSALGTLTTDEDGNFSKAMDKPVSLKLSLTLPDGHRTSYDLDLEPDPHALHSHDDHADHDHDHDHQPTEKNPDTYASEIIRLRKELEAMQSQRRLRDVLGGIGIIFGIAGVVAVAKSKSSTRR